MSEAEPLDVFCPHGYAYGDGLYMHYGHASDGCERSPSTPIPSDRVVVADVGMARLEGLVPSDRSGAGCVVRLDDGRRLVVPLASVADARGG